MATEERLQEIYNEQGRPGAEAFRFAVRRAGYEISATEAKANGQGRMARGWKRTQWRPLSPVRVYEKCLREKRHES